MRDPRNFQFNLPASGRPAAFAIPEKIHRAAWAAAKQCTGLRPGGAKADIQAIIIHATAGSSSEGAISVMIEGRASFHWIIPDENEAAHENFVWATAPEARAAWHVRGNCSHPEVCQGARRLNRFSLGIEIVNAQSGGDRFSEWQIRAAADLVRYAWAKYPKLVHVASHARLDPQRRTDPGPHFPWEEFEALVLGRQRLRTTNSV